MLQNQQVFLKITIWNQDRSKKLGQKLKVTKPFQFKKFSSGLCLLYSLISLSQEAPSLFMTSNWWQSFFSMHRELRRPYWLFSACFFILSWWYMDVSFLWVIILAKVNIWHYRDFLINIVCTSPVIPRIVFVPEATWPYRALYVIIQGKLN